MITFLCSDVSVHGGAQNREYYQVYGPGHHAHVIIMSERHPDHFLDSPLTLWYTLAKYFSFLTPPTPKRIFVSFALQWPFANSSQGKFPGNSVSCNDKAKMLQLSLMVIICHFFYSWKSTLHLELVYFELGRHLVISVIIDLLVSFRKNSGRKCERFAFLFFFFYICPK